MNAVTVKIGDIIDLTDAKSGRNDRGYWLMAFVKSERGPESVDIFVDGENAREAAMWDTGRVLKILDVRHTIRKYNDKWYHSAAANVVLEKGPAKAPHRADDKFLTPPPDDLDGLPFA